MQSLASQMPQMPKRGGMFGGDGKFGVGQAIVAALNGYLASQGNPVGIANMQMMQEAAQAKREEAQYEQRRQQMLNDQISLYDYKAAHPEAPQPTEFERLLLARGFAPGSPEYNKALDSYINYRQSPDQLVNVPGVGLVQVPRNGAPSQQARPLTDADIDKMGGATGSPSSGNFPY
jgi:hypothetical protein